MSDVTQDSGHREHREDTNSFSNEYDVDDLEDARGSTSCRDDGKNLQVETLPCAVTSREEGTDVNSNQLCQGKEQTSEQPKPKRPRLSVKTADMQTAETQNEHIPEETRNAIPDMNDTDMSMLLHHAPSVSHETHMNPNSRHQGRDLQNQYLEPQPAISNFASVPSINVAAGNMFPGNQPLQYPEVGNSELEFATTIGTGSNYGFYKSSGGSGILQDKQQHPMFVPGHSVRSDDSIIPWRVTFVFAFHPGHYVAVTWVARGTEAGYKDVAEVGFPTSVPLVEVGIRFPGPHALGEGESSLPTSAPQAKMGSGFPSSMHQVKAGASRPQRLKQRQGSSFSTSMVR
ncbi:hypothetical protein BHE74_00018585 [Ensete ventricosum]|nr:hypothetical protein BHE74_00018585 [Ensete ventricosum]